MSLVPSSIALKAAASATPKLFTVSVLALVSTFEVYVIIVAFTQLVIK